MEELYVNGYSPVDIISTLFRVVKFYDMNEYEKLEFIRYIGYAHMRCLEGVESLVQLSALLAKLCALKIDMIVDMPFA
jgi:replication factor C subunit 2/4